MDQERALSIPRLTQNLIYPLLKVLFGFFFKLKIESQENIKELKGPLIIAINHGSWVDSFAAPLIFPFNSEVFPIHYACWWKYYYFPLFTPLLWLVGSFPIRKSKRGRKGAGLEKVLMHPLRILRQGGVVGIYPEGKRRHKGRPRKGRRGPAYLAVKTNTPVLPIKIEGNVNIGIWGSLLRRNELKVKVGKMFYLPFREIKSPEDLNSDAELIMNKVRIL